MNLGRQVAVSLAVVAMAAAAWIWWPRAEVVAGGGRPGPQAPVVVTVPAGQDVWRTVLRTVGDGSAVRSAVLSPALSGRVAAVRAADGDGLDEGDAVIELDGRAARLTLEGERLRLSSARDRAARLSRLAASGSVPRVEAQEAVREEETAGLAVAQAERALDDLVLKAPFAGVLGLLSVRQGDMVGPQDVVATLDDVSSLVVEFRVPERYAPLVTPGTAVSAVPLADRARRFAGEVTAVDSRIETDSRTLRVRSSVPNPDGWLRAGMSFEVEIAFEDGTWTSVPPQAVQRDSGGAYVWTVEGGRASRVPVRIVSRGASAVLVDGKIGPGDAVVTLGMASLREGSSVSEEAP